MLRPHPIKFPLKITEGRDPDCHAVVADANDDVVIRLVVGELEMLKVIVRELNARAAKPAKHEYMAATTNGRIPFR
jgi:hypothetical protein